MESKRLRESTQDPAGRGAGRRRAVTDGAAAVGGVDMESSFRLTAGNRGRLRGCQLAPAGTVVSLRRASRRGSSLICPALPRASRCGPGVAHAALLREARWRSALPPAFDVYKSTLGFGADARDARDAVTHASRFSRRLADDAVTVAVAGKSRSSRILVRSAFNGIFFGIRSGRMWLLDGVRRCSPQQEPHGE